MRFPIKISQNFLLEPVLHTFGVNPETSWVEVGETTLEVSMGRWFHEVIPLSAVASVAPSEWPWWGGLGVKLAHHGVGVVGSTDGVVNIAFKTPVKAHVIAVVEAQQLWISVEDHEAFLKALAAKTGLAVSPFAKF